MFWQLRDNIEWSLNIQTEVFIEFTLLWLSWHSISIYDIPLLVETVMSVPHEDISVLTVMVALEIHNLSFFVDNVGILVSEELPPS